MPAGFVPRDAAAPALSRSRFAQRQADAIVTPSADTGLIGLLEFRVFGMGLGEGMRPFQHGAVAFAAPDFQIVGADIALLVVGRDQKLSAAVADSRIAVSAAVPARTSICAWRLWPRSSW